MRHCLSSIVILISVSIVLSGCVPPTMQTEQDGAGGGSTASDLAPIQTERLRSVNDWAYQLQGTPVLDLAAITQSAFDLVVIDYSADGSETGEFTAEQIAALQQGGRVVLAYMSIGEAEVGRFYWDDAWVTPVPDVAPDGPFSLTASAPNWLAPPNPEFPDNFKVRYFDPEWQQIIINNPGGHPVIADAKSYLDRIIDAGFDGVYLDIIDAFEFFGPADLGGNGERADAASLMIDFVIAIANHARQTRGQSDFLVFPQNGSAILNADAFPTTTVPTGTTQEAYAAQRSADYFAAINGIGAEDSFYFGDADNDNPLAPQTSSIESLDTFREAGLLVLAIDYVTSPTTIDDFYIRARQRGWVPYASTRDLNQLTVNATQPPD